MFQEPVGSDSHSMDVNGILSIDFNRFWIIRMMPIAMVSVHSTELKSTVVEMRALH